MTKSKPALIGFSLFAVVSVLVTYLIWATLQRAVPGDTDRYSATFSDVLGLRVGDDVRMAGVRVGRVHSIARDDNDNARIEFDIQRRQRLFRNTKAMVRYQNLIGQRYVALAAGAGRADALPAGGSIPLEQTEPSFDVSTLLAGFEPLFSVLQPDQVNSLSQTLIQALQGDAVSLSALITQAVALASTFSERDAILGEVITNLSGVIAGLSRRSSELATLITQARELTSGLYAEGELLKTSVSRAAATTESLLGLLTKVAPGLAQAQRDASTGVRLLLHNGAALDRAAVQLPDVLNAVARFTSSGAYAMATFCSLDVSLWNVVLPRGLVSQIGGNSHSEVCR
ncbi:MAG: MCE family protein [Mycobacteriaceae bacterium]|nr:MCE family protein [Mycobacteriaceae bacterium]